MKKKLFILLLGLFLFFPLFTFAKTPEIYVNGEKIISDVDPFIKNDRLYVPLRFIGEKLGMKVDYEYGGINDDITVTLTSKTGKEIYCNDFGVSDSDGMTFALINLGDESLEIKNDRTFVPMRFIANALHMDVKWDNNTKTAYFNDNNEEKIYPIYFRDYSDWDNEMVLPAQIFKIEYSDGHYYLLSTKYKDKITPDQYMQLLDSRFHNIQREYKNDSIKINKNNPEEIFYDNVYLVLSPDKTRVDGYIYN